MKKITLLLVIIFTFLFSNTSWGDWTFVEETDTGIKFYYDKDRVRKSGKYLYFWELIDLLKPDKWGNLSITRYIQLDCSILRTKFLKFHRYNNSMGEGKLNSSSTPKDEWNYPPPDSVDEIVCNFVCEEHQ
jgi:hypothetical protein